MASNRPSFDDAQARSERSRGTLPPGPGSSRAHAWRGWLTQSLPGRVLIAGLAIKAIAAIVGAMAPSAWTFLDLVDAIGSLALIFVACYAVTKLIVWAKRRL